MLNNSDFFNFLFPAWKVWYVIGTWKTLQEMLYYNLYDSCPLHWRSRELQIQNIQINTHFNLIKSWQVYCVNWKVEDWTANHVSDFKKGDLYASDI